MSARLWRRHASLKTTSGFGKITSNTGQSKLTPIVKSSKAYDYHDDPDVQAVMNPPPKLGPTLLSPLKQKIFETLTRHVTPSLHPGKQYHVTMYDEAAKTNRRFAVTPTAAEAAAVKPSLYVSSYRIKGSVKKAMALLRMLRGMPLDAAITQCHFAARRMSRDVADMLTRARDAAPRSQLSPDDLRIAQIWVGKEPRKIKRADYKARSRVGIIEHKWIHVKAVLDVIPKSREGSRGKVAHSVRQHSLRSRAVNPRHTHNVSPLQEYRW